MRCARAARQRALTPPGGAPVHSVPMGLAVAGLLLAAGMAARADEPPIHLEWRPAAVQAVGEGPVVIGLYAVCDPGQTQLMRAADIIFAWDPAVLRFDAIDNDVPGTAPALSSTLPANDPYNLNGPTIPPADGDGYFRWWANLGVPVEVTDAGVLLTTFRFTALAVSPETLVTIPASGGQPYVLPTRIYGSNEAGVIVTGTLGQCQVTVGEPHPLDINRDGMVDAGDLFQLTDCMNGPEVLSPPPGCDVETFDRADLNDDGDVDLHDVSDFQALFAGS